MCSGPEIGLRSGIRAWISRVTLTGCAAIVRVHLPIQGNFMSETPTPPNPGQPGDQQIHRFAHNPTSARVPERVSRGATATGFMAFFGPNEFVIDFLQFISRPANLVARVVMAPVVAEHFLGVLRENLNR